MRHDIKLEDEAWNRFMRHTKNCIVCDRETEQCLVGKTLEAAWDKQHRKTFPR